jgi:leucyl aminopeptidase (aminopeptidase T)
MDNQARDLREAAFVFIKELLNLKQGERLLIYIDQESDYCAAKAIQESAQQIGALTEIFEINFNQKLPDLARELTNEIEKGDFDAICELSEQSFCYSPPWQKALQSGSRIYSLAGLNADAFISSIGKVNQKAMFQFGMALRGILKKAKSIQIVTKKGTEIKFQMDTNLVSRFIPSLEDNIVFRFISRLKRKFIPKLTRTVSSYIASPSGSQIQRGQGTFMGGQLGFRGIPETIEGTAVIDGYLWPPKEISRIDTPIILNIKKGNVVEIKGDPIKSQILNKWFEGEPREIIHFLFGFNPGATLSGKIMEAERVFGNISVGIGKFPFHVDGVIKNPSIILDDKVIEQDGSFINEELTILEKDLIKNN